MMYYIGFLFQAAQAYYGTGLTSAMRTDLVITNEKIILKNLGVTKNLLSIMIEYKWLEQPRLVPNRKEIAKKQ